MLAIHNYSQFLHTHTVVANAFAKLSKCQQFTTYYAFCRQRRLLQTLLQSYQNVSNSQLSLIYPCFALRCKRFCKVIKMLAIHNLNSFKISFTSVANAFAKLSKCQQFTTEQQCHSRALPLQTLLQSYQNVSNSQLIALLYHMDRCCKRFCKVIKMLAIHNLLLKLKKQKIVANAFAKLSKCQQFTTNFIICLCLLKLQTLLQSYQNVSNSQLKRHIVFFKKCCKRFCKVIKMLAIHNTCLLESCT